jgi:hypothetical protein
MAHLLGGAATIYITDGSSGLVIVMMKMKNDYLLCD